MSAASEAAALLAQEREAARVDFRKTCRDAVRATINAELAPSLPSWSAETTLFSHRSITGSVLENNLACLYSLASDDRFAEWKWLNALIVEGPTVSRETMLILLQARQRLTAAVFDVPAVDSRIDAMSEKVDAMWLSPGMPGSLQASEDFARRRDGGAQPEKKRRIE